MIKVPHLVKDWGSRSTYNYADASKADSEVIGMCLLASGFSFGLLRKLVSTQNSFSCSYSTQYERY